MLTPPIIIFEQWDTDEVASPVGRRNIPGGFGYIGRVALGCRQSDPMRPGSTSGTFVYRDVAFNAAEPVSQIASKVEAMTVRLGTSGVGISNLRLYLISQTALTIPCQTVGLDPAFVQMTHSGVWQPHSILPSGAGVRLTTTIPTTANVRRQDGDTALLNNNDDNVSEFVYSNIVAPLGMLLGSYGACGSGLLRLGLVFDYFDASYLLPPGSV